MTFQSMGDLLPNGPTATDLGERTDECETHGPFRSTGFRYEIGKSRGYERWTRCPQCNLEAERAQVLAQQQARAAEQQTLLEDKLGSTAIPKKFLERTIDTFVVDTPEKARAKKSCQYYVDNFESMLSRGMGIVMSGSTGTGKSHLACGILMGILPAHVGVYTTFMGMLGMIRDTYEKGSKQSEREVIARLSRVPLLVIDEIGVQRGTDDEHVQLFGILNARYNDKLPTILLTNQDRDGLQVFVGDRLFDRITETTRWLDFNWSSYRATMREQNQ